MCIFIGMEIRALIKEELNDFNWVDDIPIVSDITYDEMYIGMRVVVTSDWGNLVNCVNQTGTVVGLSGYGRLTITFDETFTRLQSNGNSDPTKSSWHFNYWYFEKYPYTNKIQKLD